MKKIQTLFAVGFLAVLTSCGTTQQTTKNENSSVKVENNRGRSNQQMQENTVGRTKTETSPQLSSEKKTRAESVRNSDSPDNARNQLMYTSLNMKEEQVERFENEWKNATGTWKRSNRNKSMNSFEKVEYQDRILKNILDESQFEAYRTWARENPMKD